VRFKVPELEYVRPDKPEVDFGYAAGSYMHRLLSDGGLSYEADVSALLVALGASHRHTVFVNVGANISYFPVLLGAVFGSRFEIHGFEPMPALHEMGVAGLLANGLVAESSAVALSSFVGTAEFHLSAQTDSSNSLNPTFRETKSVVEVEVSTLDEVFVRGVQSRSLADRLAGVGDSACLMVIDTESTEPDVLRGGSEMINRLRPHIVCEVLAGRTEARLQEIVDSHGYVPYRLTDDELVRQSSIVGDPTYSHRDWLFAPEELDTEIIRRYPVLVKAFQSTKVRNPSKKRPRSAAAAVARRLGLKR